jgi:GTP-binding protein YchF
VVLLCSAAQRDGPTPHLGGLASRWDLILPLPSAAMERFGFVGLPNAGKSSLYNALSGGSALAAPYAFATTDPNVGVAKVPDARLDALAEMSESKSVVPAAVEFLDIGGLVEGASKGEGLGNKFLGGIREVDAIVYVLRAFDEGVPGPTDPLEHLRVLEIELTLADLESVESQVKKRQKAARADPSLAAEARALEAACEILGEGTPIYRSDLSAEHREALRPWFLLTNKPVLAIVNVSEDQLDDAEAIVAPVRAELDDSSEVIAICVQLEAEAAQLDVGERAEMLDALGLGEGALPRFVRTAYHLLGLRTFLTTGEKESRAWTFRAGAKAPECAGVIHTDFERGFIRAEVIDSAELLEIGSWSAARDVGKLRIEGKDYEAQDGDVMEFRFNV